MSDPKATLSPDVLHAALAAAQDFIKLGAPPRDVAEFFLLRGYELGQEGPDKFGKDLNEVYHTLRELAQETALRREYRPLDLEQVRSRLRG